MEGENSVEYSEIDCEIQKSVRKDQQKKIRDIILNLSFRIWITLRCESE